MSEENVAEQVEKNNIPEGHYRSSNSGLIRASVSEAEAAVRTLLRFIGEDPDREGLKETPARVVRAWREMTSGYYSQEPVNILKPIFYENTDEVVIVRNIPFISCCEHHMLVYSGTIDVGYIPGCEKPNTATPSKSTYRVVGLSKLARLVDHFSRRLSLQERLTRQVADSIDEVLRPEGVGVIARASHSCIECRGVMKAGTECVTSAMVGAFRTKPEARAEFMQLSRS